MLIIEITWSKRLKCGVPPTPGSHRQSRFVTRAFWYLKRRTFDARRRCHVSASSHQWPTQEPCHVRCVLLHARGDKASSLLSLIRKSGRRLTTTHTTCVLSDRQKGRKIKDLWIEIQSTVQTKQNSSFALWNASAADLWTSLYWKYNLCHLWSEGHKLGLYCSAANLCCWNLRGRKEPVSRAQKAF